MPINVGEGNASERPIVRDRFSPSVRDPDIHFGVKSKGREDVVFDTEKLTFLLLFLHPLLHCPEGVG